MYFEHDEWWSRHYDYFCCEYGVGLGPKSFQKIVVISSTSDASLQTPFDKLPTATAAGVPAGALTEGRQRANLVSTIGGRNLRSMASSDIFGGLRNNPSKGNSFSALQELTFSIVNGHIVYWGDTEAIDFLTAHG